MTPTRSTPVQLDASWRTIAVHLAVLGALAVPFPAAAADGEHLIIEGKVTLEVVWVAPTPAPSAPPERLASAAPLRFELARAEPVAASRSTLEALAHTLVSHPDLQLRIEAHTDDLGDDTLNQTLSQRRAAWVLRWLAGHGVAAGRLSSVGFGASRPVAPNDSEAGRQLNRRVDFVLLASR